MELATKTNIHFTDFYSLFSWDVKAYLSNSSGFNPTFPLVLFGEFLSKANVDKVKIEDNEEYKILGVRSYGKGAFENRFVKGSTLKMKEYYRAKANHLFWCKVDTKNGAFGVIKNDLADGLGSTNMTFAEINTNKINVDFLQLLFTSKGVMQYLDSYVTGTTNRKYIRPDQLLNEIKIPLPTLAEQQQIVDAYTTKIQQAQALQAQANNLEEEIERYLSNVLGIKYEEKKKNKGLYFLEFQKIERWDFWNENSHSNTSNYPTAKIKNLIHLKSGSFLPASKMKQGEYKVYGGNGVLGTHDDFFLSGKRLVIGRVGEYCGNVHLIDGKYWITDNAFIVDKISEEVTYEYLEIGLNYLNLNKYRVISAQPSISQGAILSLEFPIPPIKIQNEIVNKITNLKSQIQQLTTNHSQLKIEAEQEFEKQIFHN